jgi:uncharacterized protein YdaU (DUF1376 family)
VNYYPHHIGDYDAATAHLTWLQDMAYMRLMRLYYRTETPIPADIHRAFVLVRATKPAERQAVKDVLEEFFVLEADGWHQKRCDEELRKASEKSAKARAAAQRSVSIRSSGRSTDAQRTLNGSTNGRSTDVELTNNQEPITNNQTPPLPLPPPVDNSTGMAPIAEKLAGLGVRFKSENMGWPEKWIADGATEELLCKAVEIAREAKPPPDLIPAAYLAPIVARLRSGSEPRERGNGAWWTSEEATNAAASRLGIHAKPGESWDSFRGRIRAEIDVRKGAA